MGNSNENSYRERFYEKYAFNQMIEDANFGPIKVYRKKQLNFDYVMVLQKYVSQRQLHSLTHEIKCVHESFLTQEQPMALRIFNFNVTEGNWSDCRLPLLHLYVQYFNYTLHDLIIKHQERGEGFSLDEIIYILWSALHTYRYFHTINPLYFCLNPEAIYLTPEGCIKFTPIKIKDFFQENDALCKALLNTTTQKEVVNFQRGQKTFILELKRLLKQLIYLQPRQETIELGYKVDKAHTLKGLQEAIGIPHIDCISLVRKEGETTESFDSYSQRDTKSTSQKTLKKSMKRLNIERSK